MEAWKNFLNKNGKVIYEDGQNHFSKKTGKITEITETHLILKVNSHSEAINLTRILRIEELQNE
jgi:hypothetical protein